VSIAALWHISFCLDLNEDAVLYQEMVTTTRKRCRFLSNMRTRRPIMPLALVMMLMLILQQFSSCRRSTFGVYSLSPASGDGCRSSAPAVSRRDVLKRTTGTAGCIVTSAATSSLLTMPFPSIATTTSATATTSSAVVDFRTNAEAEYTNSITASRDTNVSPLEAYDSIMKYIPPAASFSSASSSSASARTCALDVGAGAGLSTSYLHNQLGYKNIDAVDWSGDAWRQNVVSHPETVQFYEMDDDAFFQSLEQQQNQQEEYRSQSGLVLPRQQYQVICYNFAINAQKAVRVARRYLSAKDDASILFAPVNDKTDYWYKQTYYTFNNKGEIVSQSPDSIGSWSIVYQPDVTSTSCTGIWCRDFNGYNNKKKSSSTQNRST
jgi:hypothetical protein